MFSSILKKYFLLFLILLITIFASAQIDSIPVKKQKFPFSLLKKVQDGNLKFVPIPIFTVSPEKGASFGVAVSYFFRGSKKVNDSATRLSGAFLNFQYSTRKQLVAEMLYTIYTSSEKYYIQGSLGYKDFYERYWTLSDINSSNQTFLGLQYQQLFAKGRALKNIGNQTFFGVSYSINNINNIVFENKPMPTIPNVAGSDKSFVVGIGPAISVDKRDNQFSPQKGWYAEASMRFFEKWIGSNYTFNQTNIDVRKYVITKPKGILALNAVATISNGTVPLLEKQRLGNDKIMRGYFAGRFRDDQMLAAQMEYRYPLGKSFVVAAFISAGQTASTLHEMSYDAIQSSTGGGLRYLVNKQKQLYIRIDAGYTKLNNWGFYFNLGDAF